MPRAKVRRRQFLPYYGSKWLLGDWINDKIALHYPCRPCYAEACSAGYNSGARQDAVPIELYNDLHPGNVNLFHCLVTWPQQLLDAVQAIPQPLTDDELRKTFEAMDVGEPLQRAAKYLHYAHYSWRGGGDRWFSGLNNHKPPNWPVIIDYAYRRFHHLQIFNLDVVDFLRSQDRPDMVFLVDPPYLTWVRGKDKRHFCGQTRSQYEIEPRTHRESYYFHYRLLRTVVQLQAGVVICGYRSRLYDEFLSPDHGWERYDCPIRRFEKESIWIKL